MTPDGDLLLAWQEGDRVAGDELLARYFRPLLRFFRNKVATDVEDLIQQTMVACVERRDDIQEHASFRSYLFAIARGRLFDRLRKEHRRPEEADLSQLSLLDPGTSPSSAMARDERNTKLATALAGLPLDQRIVLELAYWEHLTGPEIADVVGVPANTVRSRLARARQQLRDQAGSLGLEFHPPASRNA